MKAALATLGLVGILSGCTTPYPNYNPITGAEVSANSRPQGTDAYCRQYARQTAGNAYDNRIDRSEDSFGAAAITRQRAIEAGERAYERCLSGRTN